jgi:hypothetical protein
MPDFRSQLSDLQKWMRERVFKFYLIKILQQLNFFNKKFQNIYKRKIIEYGMAKDGDTKDLRIYSSFIISIVALVFSILNPLPGVVLGIISLVQSSKQNDAISKKAKIMSIIAIIIGLIFVAISIILTLKGSQFNIPA